MRSLLNAVSFNIFSSNIMTQIEKLIQWQEFRRQACDAVAYPYMPPVYLTESGTSTPDL